MSIAVQGYAQGNHSSNSRSTHTSTRTSSANATRVSHQTNTRSSSTNVTRATPQTSTRTSSANAIRVSPQTSTRTSSANATRVSPQTSTRTSSANATRVSPQTSTRTGSSYVSRNTIHKASPQRAAHRGKIIFSGPNYRHHNSFYYYHGRRYYQRYCIFDNWLWYSYRGWNDRFIRHSYYADRYFDNLLGYYIYGNITQPTKLIIGSLEITRKGNSLILKNGSSYSSLDLRQSQAFSYIIENTTVYIETGSGYANIYFTDEFGNEASYQL